MMKRTIVICLSLMLYVVQMQAQCEAKNEAIQVGEKLTYELKFNWKFIWVNAGEAKMDLTSTTYNGKSCYKTDLLCVSNSKVDFFFKMRDTLTCITTPQLQPQYFRKGAEEGSRYSVDEVWFDYTKDGKIKVDQQRRVRGRNTVTAKDIREDCVFDMLSILLQARSYDPKDYKVGDKILFPMATGRRIEEQTLIYRGKKNFEAEDGMVYRCLVFSLVEYNKKGKEEEVITFFVTDDDNHLPVRLDLYLNFGSAKAYLKTVEGNRHSLTSIVKKK